MPDIVRQLRVVLDTDKVCWKTLSQLPVPFVCSQTPTVTTLELVLPT